MSNAEESQIKARVQEFAAAFNEQDAPKLAALFAEHSDFVNIFGFRMRNRSGIEAAHAQVFNTLLVRSKLSIDAAEVRLLGRDHAVCLADWSRAAAPDAGMPPGKGTLTFVLSLGEGGWQFVTGQNTQASKPPGAP